MTTMTGRERWAQPVEILDARLSSGEIVAFPDGRVFVDADVTLPESDIERLRQGRLCMVCHEPQRTPFPEVCEFTLPNGQPGCGYRIREFQARDFAIKFAGEVRTDRGRVKIADEIERLTEMDEFENRTGIILPNHVKFPNGRV